MAYNYCSLGFLRGSLSTWLQLLSVCGWRSKGKASHEEGKKPKASQWERHIGKPRRKGAASRGQGKWQVHSSRGYSTPPKDGGKAGLFSARSATSLARVKGKTESAQGDKTEHYSALSCVPTTNTHFPPQPQDTGSSVSHKEGQDKLRSDQHGVPDPGQLGCWLPLPADRSQVSKAVRYIYI